MSHSRLLPALCIAVAVFAVSGCGGGDTGASSVNGTVTTTVPSNTDSNSYIITEDTLGLRNANFLAGTNENGVFALRAAIADSMTDPEFTDIFRLDIQQPAQIITNFAYAVGENEDRQDSPCAIHFFNGEKSSYLNTVSGTVTFTSFGVNTGNLVAGSFAVQVEDSGSLQFPKPLFTIGGNFSFVVNMPGQFIN